MLRRTWCKIVVPAAVLAALSLGAALAHAAGQKDAPLITVALRSGNASRAHAAGVRVTVAGPVTRSRLSTSHTMTFGRLPLGQYRVTATCPHGHTRTQNVKLTKKQNVKGVTLIFTQ